MDKGRIGGNITAAAVEAGWREGREHLEEVIGGALVHGIETVKEEKGMLRAVVGRRARPGGAPEEVRENLQRAPG